jgi:hypothetical protein
VGNAQTSELFLKLGGWGWWTTPTSSSLFGGGGGVKTLSMLHRGMVNVDFIVDKDFMVREHAVLDLI